MKRLIAARRARRAFGRGILRFLYPSNRKVIAYLRRYEDEIILCVVNLARSPQAVELDSRRIQRAQPIELLGRSAFPRDRRSALSADAAGPQLLLVRAVASTSQEAANLQAPTPEFVTLVLPHGWSDLFGRTICSSSSATSSRPFWRGSAGSRPRTNGSRAPRCVAQARSRAWRNRVRPGEPDLAAVVEAVLARQRPAMLFLAAAPLSGRRPRAICAKGCVPVTLAEAAPVPPRRRACRRAVAGRLRRWRCGGDRQRSADRCRCDSAAKFASAQRRLRRQCRRPEQRRSRRVGAEQSNSSALFDEYGVLKIYRRLQPGHQPEIEMSPFLTERPDSPTRRRARHDRSRARRRQRAADGPRSACWSPLCAIRATAGPRRSTI